MQVVHYPEKGWLDEELLSQDKQWAFYYQVCSAVDSHLIYSQGA